MNAKLCGQGVTLTGESPIEQLRREGESTQQLLQRMGFYNDGSMWFDSHAWDDARPHA